MAKTPYFNKRRWLESRQDEITELYRTGKSWREIVEHLKNSHAMPFPLTEPDFFKYCDFLLDAIGTSHFEENIELQRQLADLKNQFSTIEKAKASLHQENEVLKEKNIKLTARVKNLVQSSQEQDEILQENKEINSKQAKKLIQQINLNKQLEQSNTELSLKNEQQAGKLKEISKYMNTIQIEIEKISTSEQELKQDALKAKNTNFWLKILLVTLVIGMGLLLIGK